MSTDAFLDKLSSDDAMLNGLDDTCVRSINGARVAIQILKLGSFCNRACCALYCVASCALLCCFPCANELKSETCFVHVRSPGHFDVSSDSASHPIVVIILLVTRVFSALLLIFCPHAVRRAQRRGLYSNAMGYLGGINLAIMVARICQRNKNRHPAALVSQFFTFYSQVVYMG